MGYSLFQTSTLGMQSYSHALDTIATNIANVSTGGYKRTDTRFATVVSSNVRTGPGADSSVSFANEEHGLGGVRPKDLLAIDQQGLLQATERSLDVAIAGGGFFQVSPDIAVTNDILFTRDGSFDINVAGSPVSVTADDGSTISVRQGYLTDKNGFFVLGAAPDLNGNFLSATTLQALRVDQFAFTNQFKQSATANLQVNLDAKTKFGAANENTSLSLIDSLGGTRAVTASFVKTPTTGEWQMLLDGDNLTNVALTPGGTFSLATGGGSRILQLDPATRQISVRTTLVPAAGSPGAFIGLKVGDPISLTGTTSNNATFTIGAISSDFSTITVNAGTPLSGGAETVTTATTLTSTRNVGTPLQFDATGKLTSPTSFTANLTWSDGATNAVTLDISKSTQFSGAFTLINFSQDGLARSSLRSVTFDNSGHVIGNFEDGTSRKIYKLALATFNNPNALEVRNGNTFAESTGSGVPRSVFADVTGIALLQPNTVELSNVELASQFTQMIKAQQAYNSSATVFRTVDEMVTVARDLKA